MSYQVLARKWRPEKFQEIVGQEHITRSLQNSILKNRLGHAYLFAGTRGIGKTSLARLFARSLRCLSRLEDGNPCGNCRGCEDFTLGQSLNVYEIDGASNNSVDNIRALITTIQTLPTFGAYKVYIIDEVHMLSASAFNALLKTLEEPPAHAIFILATTEPHKLLDTVLSRCQRFDFKDATEESLVKHLKKISEAEKINFANEGLLKRLCYEGKGSIRDTLSLFDQVLSFSINNDIDEITLSSALGIATRNDINMILHSVLLGDSLGVSQHIYNLLNKNISAEKLCYGILDVIYSIITNLHDPRKLKYDLDIDVKDYEEVSEAEWIWIFETLSTDFKWGLESLYPSKSVEIILKKVSLRREFFVDNSKKKIKSSKDLCKIENVEVVVEVPTDDSESCSREVREAKIENSLVVTEEVVHVEDKVECSKKNDEREKDWQSFLEYLKKDSCTAAFNLEQGNLIGELDQQNEEIHFKLGFSHSGKVFYNYLNEEAQREKLRDNLSSYFDVKKENLYFELELLNDEKKNKIDFKSMAEVYEEVEKNENDKREQKFLQEAMIIEAQNIFKSKVDKVKLK